VEQDLTLTAQARRHQALARRARIRAMVDIVLIGASTGLAAFLAGDPHQSLMAGSLILSLGILVYVIRRARALTARAGGGRWRDEALEGRGLTLEDWSSGAELEPWESRKSNPVEQAD